MVEAARRACGVPPGRRQWRTLTQRVADLQRLIGPALSWSSSSLYRLYVVLTQLLFLSGTTLGRLFALCHDVASPGSPASGWVAGKLYNTLSLSLSVSLFGFGFYSYSPHCTGPTLPISAHRWLLSGPLSGMLSMQRPIRQYCLPVYVGLDSCLWSGSACLLGCVSVTWTLCET